MIMGEGERIQKNRGKGMDLGKTPTCPRIKDDRHVLVLGGGGSRRPTKRERGKSGERPIM